MTQGLHELRLGLGGRQLVVAVANDFGLVAIDFVGQVVEIAIACRGLTLEILFSSVILFYRT